MILKRLIFFVCFVLAFACSRDEEQFTLKNDQDGTELSTETGSECSSSERLVVEVDSKTAEALEKGESISDEFAFTRVFPEDKEFEERHRKWGLHKIYFAEAKDGSPATKAISKLEFLRGILHIEKVPGIRQESVIPFNDPNASSQWHLYNGGNLGSTFVAGADINVLPAWNYYTAGDNKVIVGVVDTGVQADHPDLAASVIPAGSDGSKSFLNSTASNPYNITGQRHGTHVAGIIAAVNNNGIGVCGIAGGNDGKGGVKIMDLQAIKTDDSDGGNTYSAFIWAADHGAVILNNSWSFAYDNESDVPSSTDTFSKLAINYFINNAGVDSDGNQTGPMKGGLVLFSAGNQGWTKSQPAMYDAVVAVGATGPANDVSSYTNYGDWVDICAPGGNANAHGATYGQIYSTVSGSGYAAMQGTSMSCPVASGVAALLVSYYGGPGFTNEDLKEMLLTGANREASKNHNKKIGPLVDAYESLSYKDKPLTPTKDIDISCRKTTATIKFAVKAYGNECLHFYRVFVSENESNLVKIDPFNYSSSIRSRLFSTAAKEPGETISTDFTALTAGTEYYCTVVGYTKSHRYSLDNAIVSFTMPKNTSPVISCPGLDGRINLTHKEKKALHVDYYDEDGDNLTLKVVPGSDAVCYNDDGKGNLDLYFDGSKAVAGGYKASITVSDGTNTVSTSISYTILPNSTPVADQNLADRTLSISSSLKVDLSGVFSDADGDDLQYSCSISGVASSGNSGSDGDSDVDSGSDWDSGSDGDSGSNGDSASFGASKSVSASIEGSTLSVSGLDYGSALISITADDGFGGTASSSFRVRVEGPNDNGVSIYPMAVTDRLYISTTASGSCSVSISNASGRTIFSKKVNQDPFNPYYVDMSKCVPGIYTVKVENKDCSVVRKVVKR